MKQTIPLLITFLSGAVLIVAAFIPVTQGWKDDVVVWFDILAGFAFVLGGGNLLFMHLRKISDRQAGWAYSAITLIAFAVTLFVGFLKIGVMPAQEGEKFGQVHTSLELADFPTTVETAGSLPAGKLPAVVKGQLTSINDNTGVRFTGWMTDGQRDQLKKFEFEKGWHDIVDALYEKSQPKKDAGKVSFQSQLGTFSFEGDMKVGQRDFLLSLSDNSNWQAAVNNLYESSTQVHAIELDQTPKGVSIPDDLKEVVTIDEQTHELRVKGPMSLKQRDVLANQFPDGDVLSDDEKQELLTKLQAAGEVSNYQQAVLKRFIKEFKTNGERGRELYFALSEPYVDEATGATVVPTLNEEQSNILLDDYRLQNDWYHTVNNLLLAAHQTKYPWSGAVDAEGGAFWYLYEYVLVPLTSTMFALLAFYVASAAFRAFRAKNTEAILLLGTAFIILLGRTIAGTYLTAPLEGTAFDGLTLSNLTIYIMGVFNTAGNRAIMIGIALGIASTSLKVMLGIDRSYLGSDRN